MRWSRLARGGFVAVTLCCFGLPQAEAVEIFDGPSLAAHLNDAVITQVRGGRGGGGGMRRGGGGMHRGGGMNRGGFNRGGYARGGGYRGGAYRGGGYRGAGYRGGAYRGGAYGYRGGAYRGGAYGYRGGAYRGGYYGNWARPGWYGWRPGGAIAAGAAIGFVGAATAAAWAGPAPGPGLCWYYTDPSRRQGFWDACQ